MTLIPMVPGGPRTWFQLLQCLVVIMFLDAYKESFLIAALSIAIC